jgi:hypothetical protein
VEREAEAFEKLRAYAKVVNRPGFRVTPLLGEFIQQLPAVSRIVQHAGENPFKFVFLDPKGWSDIPMQHLAGFLKGRSCEVLINLMTRFIIRFLGQPDRAESYRQLFGRDDVLPLLQSTENEERADVAVANTAAASICCAASNMSPRRDSRTRPGRQTLFPGLRYQPPVALKYSKPLKNKAARLQDEVRYQAKVKKTGQPELMLAGTPQVAGCFNLWENTAPRHD